MLRFRLLPWLALALCIHPDGLFAQRRRIHGPVDNARRHTLRGHLHPGALPENDVGPLDTSEQLPALTLMLKPSDAQQADLEQLLAAQQDPSSPQYHHWITPEEYADRFGVSAEDIDKITAWLGQQNLRVTATARARNWVAFTGTAGEVENAFGTRLRRYNAGGKRHFANATEPTLPVAIEAVVRGIHGLNDFTLQPRSVKPRAAQYTTGSGRHYLSPEDLALVYNIKPLYDAGLDGSGQKIVVPGQTRINVSDIQMFRTRFQLPANDPEAILVPNTRDPGISPDDLVEANLDLQWAGAVAPNAKVIYVYSYNVMDAVQYAIDQNLAPVLSLSYGLCEAFTSRSDALIMQSWAQQGNAQGITWFNASGDSGGADCVTGSSTSGAGLAVDLPAAIPEVTGVGGTEFSEGTEVYWNFLNTAAGGSVRRYIPEAAWNDSGAGAPASGGGGSSRIFAKPSWQTGAGVPDNGARHVPDVALTSSGQHDGYLIYSSGTLQVIGGTSAAAPAFAGIATLLNQYLVSSGAQSAPGLGNINPKLYSLAQTSPAAFHDVTTGDNIVTVTCNGRRRNCTSGSFGFAAGPNYDRATGLGSVDAYNFVMAWKNPGFNGKTSASMSLASVVDSGSVILTAMVNSSNGGVPAGTVTFYLGDVALGSAPLADAVATLTLPGLQFAEGVNTVRAEYSGDVAYEAATASVTL